MSSSRPRRKSSAAWPSSRRRIKRKGEKGLAAHRPFPFQAALSDAEYGARNRTRPLAHAPAVIPRLDDPLAARTAAGDHADVMRPNHHRANLRSGRPAPMRPVVGEVEFGPAALLRPHPPAAPARRLSANTPRRIGRAGGPMRRLISGRLAGGMMLFGMATLPLCVGPRVGGRQVF